MAPKSTAVAKKSFRSSSQVLNTIRTLQNLVEDHTAWQQSTSSQLRTLHATLQKLQKFQSSQSFSSVIPTRTAEKLLAFQAWLKDQHGIDLVQDGLRLDFTEDGTQDATLFATRHIAAGDVLVTVPSSLMLTSAFTKQRSSLSQLAQAFPVITSSPSLALVLSLLAESADPKSRYAPYIAILPSAQNVPFASFNTEETLALAPSSAQAALIKVLRAQVRDYTYVFQAVSRLKPQDIPLQILSFANWRWAVSVIMSRQNAVPVPQGWSSQKGSVMACVPLWDMFNHEPGEMSTAVVVKGDDVVVECLAMRTFEPGEAVTMSYGKRSNVNLAIFSGFVSDSNLFDEVSLVIPLSPVCPLAPLKARALSKRGFLIEDENGTNGWLCHVPICAGKACLDKALAVASVLPMEKDDFAAFLKTDETSEASPTIVSLQLIETLLKEKLRQYGCAHVDDDKNVSLHAKNLINGLHNSEASLLTYAIDTAGRLREKLVSEQSGG